MTDPPPPAPTIPGQQVAKEEYDKLYAFFLEAVGIASMAHGDFHKPYLDSMLCRARAELKEHNP